MTTKTNKPLSILGVGAAACAACCAGPLIAFLAATGVLTAGGLALFGTVGLLIAIPGIAFILRRRSRTRACTTSSTPVTVAAPTRRV